MYQLSGIEHVLEYGILTPATRGQLLFFTKLELVKQMVNRVFPGNPSQVQSKSITSNRGTF